MLVKPGQRVPELCLNFQSCVSIFRVASIFRVVSQFSKMIYAGIHLSLFSCDKAGIGGILITIIDNSSTYWS